MLFVFTETRQQGGFLGEEVGDDGSPSPAASASPPTPSIAARVSMVPWPRVALPTLRFALRAACGWLTPFGRSWLPNQQPRQSEVHSTQLNVIYSESPSADPHAGWCGRGDRRNPVTSTRFTIIEACRSRSIDPWEYLRDLLTRLPSMTTSQIYEVPPDAPGKSPPPNSAEIADLRDRSQAVE
ncbi:MAG: transposase domain-containing protein [Verrucomicrobiaceae bacterium]|nr:transposase domain-containing protein [Verrucomicrobiaceae bacterium]